MRSEAWVMAGVAFFFLITAPIYWAISYDPTGTVVLTMTFLLCALVAFYLGVVARQIPTRPEDRNDGEIPEGAGEQGFFPPYSWWPMYCGIAVGVIIIGIAVAWWLFVVGLVLGFLSVCGWVFEYYRGLHAH